MAKNNKSNQSVKNGSDGCQHNMPSDAETINTLYFSYITSLRIQDLTGVSGKITYLIGETDICKTRILHSFVTEILATQCKSMLDYTKRKILFLDTIHSCSEVDNILLSINDTVVNSLGDSYDNKLDYVGMSGYSVKSRFDFLKKTMSSQSPYGVVIIDGINNFIYNQDDEKEISDFFSHMKKWAEQNNVLIITTLREDYVLTFGFYLEFLMNISNAVLIENQHQNEDSPVVNSREIRVIHEFGYKVSKIGFPTLVEGCIGSGNNVDYCDSFFGFDSFFNLDSASHTQILKEIFEENRKYNLQELLKELGEKYTDKDVYTENCFLLILIKSLEHDGIIGRNRENKYQLLVRIEA